MTRRDSSPWRSLIRRRAWSIVAVAVVVAVLAVVDVASASDWRMPGDRPADALAYVLVVAGSVEPVLEAAGTDRGAGDRDRRAHHDVPA